MLDSTTDDRSWGVHLAMAKPLQPLRLMRSDISGSDCFVNRNVFALLGPNIAENVPSDVCKTLLFSLGMPTTTSKRGEQLGLGSREA